MREAAPPTSAFRTSGVRGRPFISGNPGRKPGSRNRSTLLARALSDEDKGALISKGLELAKRGDPHMLRFFLERILPKEQPVKIDLPLISDHQDLAAAQAVIIAAVSQGQITPSEATELTSMLANVNRCLSDAELERHLGREEEFLSDLQERAKK